MTTAATRTRIERDRLVEGYLPLVRYVAARLPVTMPASLDRDDFFSAGVMGLMHAAETFDPARGASFKTFAYTAIRGAILDEIRRHDPVPRNRRDRLRRMEETASGLRSTLDRAPTLEEIAAVMGVSADDLDDDLLALSTCRLLSFDDSAFGDDARARLGAPAVASVEPQPDATAATKDMIDQLARAIGELPEIDRHVVVLYHYENLYLKEIGEIIGVSESRVSQILTRATARLRLKLGATAREP